jgi:putative phosphoribosyl transferase
MHGAKHLGRLRSTPDKDAEVSGHSRFATRPILTDMNPFTDRREAGRLLAARLGCYTNRTDVVVLAIPRGGVPVAFEIARALNAPLDVLVIQKVWAPGRDATRIGTVASGGFQVVEPAAVDGGLDPLTMQAAMARARVEVEYQERLYRGARTHKRVDGKTVIVVYDGIVTGTLMRAAVAAVRARGAARVVVAAPVMAPNAGRELAGVADDCVCCATPDPFYRIAIWYDEFAPVTDASVLFLLDRAAMALAGAAA